LFNTNWAGKRGGVPGGGLRPPLDWIRRGQGGGKKKEKLSGAVFSGGGRKKQKHPNHQTQRD